LFFCAGFLALQRLPLHKPLSSRVFSPLLLEKIPFLALAIISSILTFLAQDKGHWFQVLKAPAGLRIENAIISYCKYLGKAFWPSKLSVFYPHAASETGDPFAFWQVGEPH